MEYGRCPVEGDIVSNGEVSKPYAGFWPWPFIQRTFSVLVKKLLTVDPGVRLAVVDWWIGQLHLVRAEIEAGKFGARRRARKR